MLSPPRIRAVSSDPPWPYFLAVSAGWSLASRFVLGLFDGTKDLAHFRDRAIGSTTLQGVDASGYARNYVAMTTLLAASCFLAFVLFAALDRAVRRRIDPAAIAKELRGIQRLAEISLVLLAMRVLFREEVLGTVTAIVYFLIFLAFVVILAKVRLYRREGQESLAARLLGDSRFLIALVFLPLPLPFVWWLAFDLPISFGGMPTAVWLSAWAAAIGAAFASCYAYVRSRGSGPRAEVTPFASGWLLAAVPVFAIPISIPLANELQYVLSQHSARTVGLSVAAVLAASSAVLVLLVRRSAAAARSRTLLDFVCFPLFVATATLFKVHRQTLDLGNPDYFHTGELTVPTQQFFHFSSVPLIDLRLAHTLSDFFYPALQTAIAGYRGMDMLIWRTFLPAVVTMLLLYFFLARLVSPAFALLATAFTPVMGTVTPYYGFALVPPLVLAGAVRRPTLFRFVLVWASAVGLTLWRFDFGMVAWATLVLVLAVHLARRPGHFKTIAASLFIVAAASVAGFALVALASERPALESLLFLIRSYTYRLATRTRAELFTQYGIPAVVQYYLLPAVSLIAVLYFAVRRLLYAKYFSPGKYMLAFVAVFSLAISVRSLERHSLIEGFNPYLFVFLLASLPFLFRGTGAGRESPAARMAFFGVLVLHAFFRLPPSSYATADLAHVFERGTLFEWRDWTESSRRVTYAGERHEDLVRFLKDNLADGQTFFDFTNSPLLYVLADKKFPTYVIPNIIQTSETIQADVLADLEALRSDGRLPFVIFKQGNEFWDNVDGVPNEVRSYRIAELVYRCYAPLVTIGRYQVWVERSYEDPGATWSRYTARYELEIAPEPRTRDVTRIAGGNPREATFRAGTSDSQVASLYRLDEVPPLTDHRHWYLELRYRSPVAGQMQIFFGSDPGKFSEKASAWTELSPTHEDGFDTLRVPVRVHPGAERLADLRFDPPGGAEMTFGAAALVAGELDVTPVSAAELSQRFALGDLPRVWGRHDPLGAASRTEVVDALLERPVFLGHGEELTLGLSGAGKEGTGAEKAGAEKAGAEKAGAEKAGAEKAGYLHLRIRSAGPRFGAAEPRVLVEYGDALRGSFELNVGREALSEYELCEAPVGGEAKTYDAARVPAGGRAVFEATGGDPYVHQLLDLSVLPGLDPEESLYLLLQYRSSAAGELETFFGFDSYWFRPEDSAVVEIDETSENGEAGRVVVPVAGSGRRLTDVRFDFPAASLFEVVRVEFARRKVDDADYLVRLGTQWAWWSQDVGELRLRAGGPATVVGAWLRKGD